MWRSLLWTSGFLVLAPALLAQEGSKDSATKDKAPSVAEQVRALSAELNKERDRIVKAFRAATTNEEKNKLRTEFFALPGKFAAKCFELAEKDPKGPGAVDALAWVLANAGSGDNGKKAMDLLSKNHIENKGLGPACLGLISSRAPNVDKFLTAALEKSPHKDVQAAALYALGQRGLNNSRGDKEREAEGQKLLKRLIKEHKSGSEFAKQLVKRAETRLSLAVGSVAPEIEGEDIEGVKFKLSDYRGKVVMLDFWGHW